MFSANLEQSIKKLALDNHFITCGIHLYYVAMIIVLGACSHIGVIKLGKEIHGYAIRSNCDGFHVLKVMVWVHVPTLQFVAYSILKLMQILLNNGISNYNKEFKLRRLQ